MLEASEGRSFVTIEECLRPRHYDQGGMWIKPSVEIARLDQVIELFLHTLLFLSFLCRFLFSLFLLCVTPTR